MDISGSVSDVEMFAGLIEDFHSGAFLHDMCEDFRNLVTWAHSHSTICQHVPSPGEGYRLEEVNTFVLPFTCSAGHAYNWPVATLSGRVVEVKKFLSWTKKRKRAFFDAEAEEEDTELAEEAADHSAVGQEEGSAELDDSQNSLITNVSGEQGNSTEHREIPTPELPKAKTQRQKKKKSLSTGTQGQVSGTERSHFHHFPQIVKLAETALVQIEHVRAEDSATNISALSDSSMHLEELESDTDRASEGEPKSQPQSSGGDSETTTPSGVQQGSQSEGHLTPANTDSPTARPSTSTVSSSTVDKGKKKPAAALKRTKGILGSVCSDVMNFEAWRVSSFPNDSRQLGSLAVAELDALLSTYLHYLWEGSELHLTHNMLVQQARILDRYLKLQGCFHSVQRSSELHMTHELLEEYYEVLHERESDSHAALICSVSDSEEEELRRLGVLGRHTPEALLHLVLYNNVRNFGPAHLYRTWPLPAGKLHPSRVVPRAEPGTADADLPILDCLEWLDPADPEQTSLRMFQNTDNPLRCPLEDFRIYASKHPGGFLGPSDAVYSNHRPGADLQSSEWYSRAPMNKLHLDKTIGALAQKIETMRFTFRAMASV